MIHITADLEIHEDDLEWKFIRASGPGGQHVNKASTAVQLRFNLNQLPTPVRMRLRQAKPGHITEQGVIILESSQHRSQQRNREEALERLVRLIRDAAREPKSRKATKPSRASKERRLQDKRSRSQLKKERRRPEAEE